MLLAGTDEIAGKKVVLSAVYVKVIEVFAGVVRDGVALFQLTTPPGVKEVVADPLARYVVGAMRETVLVDVSMMETVLSVGSPNEDLEFNTKSLLPSAERTGEVGFNPTGTVATTVLLVVEMTETEWPEFTT